MIHQSKCWYVDPLNFLRWIFFTKIVLAGSRYVVLVKILHLGKSARNIYTCMLEFTFPREDVVNQRGIGWAGRRIIRGVGGIYKILHFII